MNRDIVETIVLIVAIIAYTLLSDRLAGRAYFIFPILIVLSTYLFVRIKIDSNVLQDWGIRTDNLLASMKYAAAFFVPLILILILISIFRGSFKLDISFVISLLIYPIWGIAQQFVFQSLLHSNFIKFGLAPYSIFLIAVLFAIVHRTNPQLMILTFLGGIITSYIFLKVPNIIPIGVAHGIIAAIVYYWFFGADVLSDFLHSVKSKWG